MLNGPASPVLQFIRKLAGAPDAASASDGQLLQQFVHLHDETAFAVLVQRHGPAVLGVCRRVLGHEQEAEDAFQATFLVLARKAGLIAKHESVGSWLYGVALRIAQKARAGLVRRQKRETQLHDLAALEPAPDWIWREIRPVLDEEIGRLPARYKVPFILCHLQGKSNAEAAQELGCRPGTIFSRLARARGLLRTRLTRRGLALSAGMLTSILAENTAQAAVAPALTEMTIHGAVIFATSETAASGFVSAHAIALAKGAMKSMLLSKLQMVTAVLLIGALGGTGAGIWTYRALAAGAKPAIQENAAEAAANEGNGLTSVIKVPSRKDGVVLVIGTEIAKGEKLPPERIVTVKVNDQGREFRRLKKGDRIEEGQLLALMDDPLAGSDVAIRTAKLSAATADQVASEKTRDEAKKRWETNERLFRGQTKSIEDVRAAELTWVRYVYECMSKKEAIKVAQQELNQAQTILKMSEIRSPCRGVIKKICVHRGEGVHALEPVIIIQVPEDE